MSIFKDLGFKKRSGSGEIVSPDAVRFNGKTYEEVINELGNRSSLVLSPDVDGTISVDGNNLIGTVEYLTHPGVVGANGIYYSGDYTASNVAIKGFLPDTGVYIVNLYYSSVSGTATFDLVMSDNDADVESNLYYLSPLFRFFPVSIGAISVEVDTNNGTITIDGTSKSYDKNKTSLIFGNDNANSSYEVSISGNLPVSGGDVTINQEAEQGNWVQYKAEATNMSTSTSGNVSLGVIDDQSALDSLFGNTTYFINDYAVDSNISTTDYYYYESRPTIMNFVENQTFDGNNKIINIKNFNNARFAGLAFSINSNTNLSNLRLKASGSVWAMLGSYYQTGTTTIDNCVFDFTDMSYSFLYYNNGVNITCTNTVIIIPDGGNTAAYTNGGYFIGATILYKSDSAAQEYLDMFNEENISLANLYINDTLQIVESVNGSVTTYTTQTTDTDQLTVSTDGTVDSVDIDVWVAE